MYRHLHVGQQHIARQGGFTRARHAGHGHQPFERDPGRQVLQVVQPGTPHRQPARGVGVAGAHLAAYTQRVLHGLQQVAPGLRLGGRLHIGHRALRHQPAAALAGARTNINDVLGMADGVHIVFHHHQGVALVAQALQGIQQDAVVARMQADSGLIEHVAHALQVAAQLRRQPDALGLAAAERGRAAVQCQVAQAHLLQKLQPAANLGDQVARDVGLALAQGVALQGLHPLPHIGHAQSRNIGNAHAGKAHRTRHGIEPGAGAGRAGGIHQVIHLGLGKGLLAAAVVIIAHRVVKYFALLFIELDTGADALRTPAVLAVVREQARVQLGIAGAAHRAGAPA